MKNTILIISGLLMISAPSLAQDSIKIKLIADISLKNQGFKEQTIELKSLNPQLEKEGMKGFSDSVTLTESNQESIRKFKKKLHMTSRKLNFDSIDFIGHDVNDFRGYIDYRTPEMCYTGNPAKVLDIIKAHEDILFSYDMSICGSKLGNKINVIYDDCVPDSEEVVEAYIDNGYEDAVAAWTDYSSDSKDVLLMTSWGAQGDGTELFATTIKECK